MKLYPTEFLILEILWEKGDTPASSLYRILKDKQGWSKSTTYTLLKRATDKGLIERIGDNYTCRALISKEDAQKMETQGLLGTLFNSSKTEFLSAFVKQQGLTKEEIDSLKDLVNKLK